MVQHYFSEEQDTLFELKEFETVLNGHEYKFYTASGVFSKKRLDFGTKVLVENMQVHGRVLDLGCGLGVVGYVAAETADEVVMTDINKRAVKLAKMNTKKLKNVKVVQGDQYANVEGKFDVVLLNPPQTAGKKVCWAMIADAKKYLVKGGSLQVVARHNKGGKTISLYMKEEYGNMETLCRTGGYRVYKSKLL
jgi:16S rRNA G1207 methylase RsmC